MSRAVHTLMHNQTNSLRAAYEQADALLKTIKSSDEFTKDHKLDHRLKNMELQLQALEEQIPK